MNHGRLKPAPRICGNCEKPLQTGHTYKFCNIDCKNEFDFRLKCAMRGIYLEPLTKTAKLLKS